MILNLQRSHQERGTGKLLCDKIIICHTYDFIYRKEKKIFDPSDIDKPVSKYREEKSKRPPVSVKFLTPDYLKIKNCSVLLERLPAVGEIQEKNEGMREIKTEIKSEIEDTIKIEHVESIKNEDLIDVDNASESLDTFEGINNFFTLNEKEQLLLDDIESWAKENEVFECPKCKLSFENLNRLKLHIDSQHKFRTKIRCPICGVCLYGSRYERHVSQYHSSLLDSKEYMLSPKPFTPPSRIKFSTGNKTSIINLSTNDKQVNDERKSLVEFDVENPWDEIVSESGRQKRTIDAEAVMKAMQACPQIRYEFKGEVLQHNLRSDVVSENYQKLRHKLEFASNLDLNSFYKEFQQHYKKIKITKRLLETNKNTLNEREQSSLQEEVIRQEAQLVKLCKEQTEEKTYNLLHGKSPSPEPLKKKNKHHEYLEALITKRLEKKDLETKSMEKKKIPPSIPKTILSDQNQGFEELLNPASSIMRNSYGQILSLVPNSVKSVKYKDIESLNKEAPKVKIYRESDLKSVKPNISGPANSLLLKKIVLPNNVTKPRKLSTSGGQTFLLGGAGNSPLIVPKKSLLVAPDNKKTLVIQNKPSTVLNSPQFLTATSALKKQVHTSQDIFYQKSKLATVKSIFRPVSKTIDNSLFDNQKVKMEPEDEELEDPLNVSEDIAFKDISESPSIILDIKAHEDESKSPPIAKLPNILKRKF